MKRKHIVSLEENSTIFATLFSSGCADEFLDLLINGKLAIKDFRGQGKLLAVLHNFGSGDEAAVLSGTGWPARCCLGIPLRPTG